MKKWILPLLAIACTQPIQADVFSRHLENNLKNGQLTENQALYYQALRVLEPETLPENFRQAGQATKCAFSLIRRIRALWNNFDPSQQATLSRMVLRPELPLSHISPSGRFKIHYTLIGFNSVPLQDLDNSRIPDYVEKAGVIMDSVYTLEVGRLNFKAPPIDDTDGPEWDIYIQNIPGSYGWTNPEKLLSKKPDIYSSYIELDNDYSTTPTKGLNGLRTTAAHEFFHMIQLGYNARDDDNDGSFDDQFLMEASCTWIEDVVFNWINDYYYYLREYFENTNVPFNYMDGWREYGQCLWFHFLTKRFGGTEIVRSVWEQMIDYPALPANNRALFKRGSSFRDELTLYYAWNAMTGSRADTVQFYPEGAAYPEIKLDGNFSFKLDTTLTSEAQFTGSRYFRFSQEDGSSFTLIPTNSEWESKNGDPRFTLALIHNGNHPPLYVSLNDNTAVRMVSNSNRNFQCTAIIKDARQKTVLLDFRAGQPVNDVNELFSCFPNPFVLKNQAVVTLPFPLRQPGPVKISILDPSGFLVRQEDKYFESAGIVYYQWNGRNNRNDPVSSGIYVYVISSEDGVLHQSKLAVVR